MPDPRRSSACDCTCVLTRIDHCLVTLSCLPCAFCFVLAYAKYACAKLLEKLPIFLCCSSSKSYLFFLLAIPILLIAAHALAKTKCKLLRDRVSRLGIRKYVRFPHCNRMPPFVVLRVPSTLGLQSAKSGCYTGTSLTMPCVRSYK